MQFGIARMRSGGGCERNQKEKYEQTKTAKAKRVVAVLRCKLILGIIRSAEYVKRGAAGSTRGVHKEPTEIRANPDVGVPKTERRFRGLSGLLHSYCGTPKHYCISKYKLPLCGFGLFASLSAKFCRTKVGRGKKN
jgi:hypothetical protein